MSDVCSNSDPGRRICGDIIMANHPSLEKNQMKFYPTARKPADNERILTLSPEYGFGHPMRWRVMEGQFLKNCTAVKYWAYLEELLPTMKIEEHTCNTDDGESCAADNPHVGCAPAFPAIHRNWGRGT